MIYFRIIDPISSCFLAVSAMAMLIGGLSIFLTIKKHAIPFLGVLAVGLGIGGLVNAIVGIQAYISHYYVNHHPCAWVALGLGIGAIIFAFIALLVSLPRTSKGDNKPAQVTRESDELIKEETEELKELYVEFSQGAIRVDGDVITIYRNWLPFTNFKAGRVSTVLFLNDIQSIDYKGSGWFNGVMRFSFKHFVRPVGFNFGKWFVWRRKKFNKKMLPIYQHLLSEIVKNNEK